MAITQKVVTILICNLCGYAWRQRFKELPGYCANPGCRSPNWNREPKEKAKK